ncbi:MarR family winged helix-turn-helix transcriptional regulator [Pseudorhodoplanes sp.]|uniref:MarR family winged helix-turn-helix transcriptional regulator n=1 Tax=Pseudorhodoplanes sp. TaxID=1934341 RepID=UPI002BC05663|nr:MarR family transcriptional regulator [Pseudorhodoplanes sp.]HWV52476.1 MarR family transcriptional regulator [Pseudorhodoplanes sp.]
MADRPQLDLSDYLPYLVNRVGAAFVAGYGKDIDEHGLSIAMWRVLAGLSTNGKHRQIDVAELTSIDVSTISRLITRLVGLGLVTRTRSDTNNREVSVELSAKGRALVNRLIPRARELEAAAVAGIPEADLAITRETLRRIYRNMTQGLERADEPEEKLAKSG